MGRAAAGKRLVLENERERIIVLNLGLTLDDMAVGPDIYRAAVEKELGKWLER